LAGSEAELWVGTLNDGLLRWNGGQTERIGEEQGLPDRRVEQIALAGATAFVDTPVGVAEVRGGKIARVLAKGRYARALSVDGNSLLVGQVEAGVMRVSLAGAETSTRRPIVARISDLAKSPHEMHQTVEQILNVSETRYALAADGLLRQESDGAWRMAHGPRR